jgi:glycosyltransferase involved in cell wall biosynthesis
LKLSIIIPAYNERLRLPMTLRRIESYLGSRGLLESSEVLVVDDGSSDGTSTLAADWSDGPIRFLRLPANRGKGAALRHGVQSSVGEAVLLCDADLSTPIEDLGKLESVLDRVPVVFGSRKASGSFIGDRQPWYRTQMGNTFNRILWVLGVRGIHDTQCGFKLLRGEVARQLFAELEVERFAFDVEILLRARRHGYEVAEVGVRWDHVEESRVHPVSDALRMLYDVLRLQLRLLR